MEGRRRGKTLNHFGTGRYSQAKGQLSFSEETEATEGAEGVISQVKGQRIVFYYSGPFLFYIEKNFIKLYNNN